MQCRCWRWSCAAASAVSEKAAGGACVRIRGGGEGYRFWRFIWRSSISIELKSGWCICVQGGGVQAKVHFC
jgi:hypothetical protein